MKITVIGCGRWGSLITWYLAEKKQHDITLYGRSNSEHMQRFISERKNDLLTLPDSVTLSTDIDSCSASDIIIISINAQGFRALMGQLRSLELRDKIVVLCMKGIEVGSGKRLSEIASEYLDQSIKIAIWVGPGHVQEFYAGIPNCMVIDSEDNTAKHLLVKEFSSDLIRFYLGNDIIGSEIGAASKNVIGIAAGMLDGMGLSTLKGALMSRGTREIARLISAMGGNELSAYGLCHLGDYEATVFSKFSHNRAFGECFVSGTDYKDLAEGYFTAKAMVELGEKFGVELPICHAVYRILYQNADFHTEMQSLFKRSVKNEFQ